MKKLIFFGLLSFLLAALWYIPLPFLAPHLSKITQDISFDQPQGTLWKGEVSNLSIQNNYLGKTSWQLDPIKSIKTFALTTKFKILSDDINAYGMAGLTLGKNILINNTQFDINARYLNTLQTKATLSGNFNGFVKHALLKQNQVPQIDGIVNWQNGALTLHVKEWAPYGDFKLDEGDYRTELKTISDNLEIKLSSKEAPIELNGDIKLQNDWIYDTNLSAKSSNRGLATMIKFAGEPQTDGTILIKKNGDLKPYIGIN